MLVATGDIRALMVKTCQRFSVPPGKIDFVVDHYLNGEMRGKSSHGVAKFCFESTFFAQRQGSPRTVREYHAFAVVDANREIGPVSAEYAVGIAVEKARRYGVGIVGMTNSQRYGILAQWSEGMALNGLLGLAMNTSRAEATVHGGRTPFLGVNPLSFAFPTLDDPFVVDMSTTLAPMGVLWEARRAGGTLPDGCFVDGSGEFTTDPDAAASAVAFGGHRGFGVSLLVQILTGSLFGFPMGPEVDSTWNTGYTFIALDPSFGGEAAGFAASNSGLVGAMESAVARDGGPLRLPGRAGRARAEAARSSGFLDIPESVHRRLREGAAGGTNDN